MSIQQRIKNFFWWLRVALTFGDVIESSLRTNDSPTDDTENEDLKEEEKDEAPAKSVHYNGKVSSVQLLVAMISYGSTFSLWRILSQMDTGGTANMLMLIVYMAIGIAVLVYFNQCRQRNHVTDDDMTTRLTARSPPWKSDDLLIVGICVFYFLGCILDVFHIISATCNGTLLECQTGQYTLSNGIHIAYHVVRIVFLGAQTLFCVAFKGSNISMKKCATWCGLSCLAAINVCLWIDTLTTRVVRFIQHQTMTPENLWRNCFLNESDMSMEAAHCLAKNTSIHRLVDRFISPLLLPFTFQTVLLFIVCCNHVAYHLTETSRLSRIFGHSTQREERGDDYGLSEDSRASEFHGSSSTTWSDESTALLGSASGIQMVGSQAWFMFIFIANVLLMALTVVVRVYTVSSAFFIYTFSFYTGMLLTMILAYHVSGDFKVLMNVPLTFLDYLLVVASFGPLTINFMSFLAQATLSKNAFGAAQRLVKIAEIYFQATSVLYAARVAPRKDDHNGFRSVVFRHTILLLAVCNGTIWVLTMGNGMNLSGGSNNPKGELLSYVEETKCYGSIAWTILYGCLAPLQIMFRFLCCLMLTRTFLRMRRFVPSNAQ